MIETTAEVYEELELHRLIDDNVEKTSSTYSIKSSKRCSRASTMTYTKRPSKFWPGKVYAGNIEYLITKRVDSGLSLRLSYTMLSVNWTTLMLLRHQSLLFRKEKQSLLFPSTNIEQLQIRQEEEHEIVEPSLFEIVLMNDIPVQ